VLEHIKGEAEGKEARLSRVDDSRQGTALFVNEQVRLAKITVGEGDGVGFIEEVVDLSAHPSDRRQRVTEDKSTERVEPSFAASDESVTVLGA
jgi:hypothetical protein